MMKITVCNKFEPKEEPQEHSTICGNCKYLGDREECPHWKPSCIQCVYGLTCSQPSRDREDCRDNDFKHFQYGNPSIRLLKLQRSGEINIVIGGEGEHEVNANWSIEKAYEHLAATCEACGGLVVHDGATQLVLMKTYGPSFVIEWMHGKLYKISIREHTTWWEAK